MKSRGGTHLKAKCEFCKKLLIADYSVLILLIAAFLYMTLKGYDTYNYSIVLSAWIAQIGVCSGFYYWKAKAENLVKLPIYMLQEMPEDMKDRTDPNQIVASIISINTH